MFHTLQNLQRHGLVTQSAHGGHWLRTKAGDIAIGKGPSEAYQPGGAASAKQITPELATQVIEDHAQGISEAQDEAYEARNDPQTFAGHAKDLRDFIKESWPYLTGTGFQQASEASRDALRSALMRADEFLHQVKQANLPGDATQQLAPGSRVTVFLHTGKGHGFGKIITPITLSGEPGYRVRLDDGTSRDLPAADVHQPKQQAAKPKGGIPEKAAEIWAAMDENQRTAVRFGMFPADVMRQAEAEGFTGKDLSVELMSIASRPPEADAERAAIDKRFPKGQRIMFKGSGGQRHFARIERIDDSGTLTPRFSLAARENTKLVHVPPEGATPVWERGDKVTYTDKQGDTFYASVWDGIPDAAGHIAVKVGDAAATYQPTAEQIQKSTHTEDHIAWGAAKPKAAEQGETKPVTIASVKATGKNRFGQTRWAVTFTDGKFPQSWESKDKQDAIDYAIGQGSSST